MAWSRILLYITRPDAELIREWINAEESVAWIVEAARSGTTCTWKAVDRLDAIETRDYCIWHKHSGRLTIPSGRIDVADTVVLDAYRGWMQTVETPGRTSPWFGANFPGPYNFTFKEHGGEQPGSLGRSEFNWAGDDYRSIGMPAHPEAKRWWQRLKSFVRGHSTVIPWPYPSGIGRARAYAFTDAWEQITKGRPVDANP